MAPTTNPVNAEAIAIYAEEIANKARTDATELIKSEELGAAAEEAAIKVAEILTEQFVLHGGQLSSAVTATLSDTDFIAWTSDEQFATAARLAFGFTVEALAEEIAETPIVMAAPRRLQAFIGM